MSEEIRMICDFCGFPIQDGEGKAICGAGMGCSWIHKETCPEPFEGEIEFEI